MFSKDVARLSGVTVRTLRHYHQIGVLPEPPRRENGYRDYGAVDVARVLRIKRLASLGLSLGQIRTVLERESGTSDGPERSVSELLDAIDSELEAEIALLEERRRAVALLKRDLDGGGVVLEASEAIRAHVSSLVKRGASGKTATAELHQLLLIDERDGGATALDAVLGLYRLMEERCITGEYVALTNEALVLPDDAGEDACSKLASRIADLLSPVLAEYLDGGRLEEWDETDPALERLIRLYDEETLSPIQARVSQLAESKIRARLGTPGEGDANVPLFSA